MQRKCLHPCHVGTASICGDSNQESWQLLYSQMLFWQLSFAAIGKLRNYGSLVLLIFNLHELLMLLRGLSVSTSTWYWQMTHTASKFFLKRSSPTKANRMLLWVHWIVFVASKHVTWTFYIALWIPLTSVQTVTMCLWLTLSYQTLISTAFWHVLLLKFELSDYTGSLTKTWWNIKTKYTIR